MILDEQVEKLQADVISLKQDLVWIIYLLEKIDKNVENLNQIPPEDPIEGRIVEKF